MQTSRRTRADGRETIELVKKFASAEFAEHGAVNFNLDRVMEASGASRSSVYHHFGNREGLIAVVSLEDSLARMMNELKAIDNFADSATTPEEMFNVMMLGFGAGASTEAKLRRLRRVSGFAATDGNKAIKEAMKEVQIAGTDEFIRILEKAASRGLIKPRSSIRGIAYLMQSMLVGRITSDVTESAEIDADWLATTSATLRWLLGTDDL